MADDSFDWVIDALHSIFSSPAWESPIMTFVDNNCVVFDAREEEGELHHTELHIQFTSLVERLLETQLEELGLSADDFSAIVLRSGKSSPLFRLLSTHLLALDDFETFRRLMVKRNLELELQAIQAVRASGRDVSLSAAAPSSTKGSVVEESDDDALRRAIAMSEADAESARQLAEMEAAVLEAAVAESLALEAQQQRLLARPPEPTPSLALDQQLVQPATTLVASQATRSAGITEAPIAGAQAGASFGVVDSSKPIGSILGSSRTVESDAKEADVCSDVRVPTSNRALPTSPLSDASVPLRGLNRGSVDSVSVSRRDGRLPNGVVVATPSSNAEPAVPSDRDWPGVSAVRALAEATLADADAVAVRRARRELVQVKNAERARALAESQARPVTDTPLPPAFSIQHAVARARGAGGTLALFHDDATPSAPPAAPTVSLDERRRAMRAQLMRQLGSEARASVRPASPPEAKE